MMSFLAWLIGSKFGRITAIAGITALVVGVVILRAFSAGAQRERNKAMQRTLKNLQTRIQTDDEIAGLSVDARRERLRSWARE